MKLKSLILFLALALTMGASSDLEGPPMKPEFNREGRTITITVTIYDNYEQVTEAKRRAYPNQPPESVYGWSRWSATSPYTCDLYVVGADAYMDAEYLVWGHELAHCLYGNFHKEID